MKKAILLGIVMLLFTSLLSGCFWPRYDEHRDGGDRGHEDRGHEEHRDEGR